jgi:hypothetical protein
VFYLALMIVGVTALIGLGSMLVFSFKYRGGSLTFIRLGVPQSRAHLRAAVAAMISPHPTVPSSRRRAPHPSSGSPAWLSGGLGALQHSAQLSVAISAHLKAYVHPNRK